MNASVESDVSNRIESECSAGHYADKHTRASFLRWSHGARFVKARKLVQPLAGKKLLDYGCGDGTFMSQVVDLFPNAAGADTSIEQVTDCRRRLGGSSAMSFYTCSEMANQSWQGSFDVVTCMEVLEHCREVVVEHVLGELCRLAKPNGQVIISVPIETGPTVMFKQLLRRFAGWKGIPGYQYTERYRFNEFLSMLFSNSETVIDRPVYAAEDSSPESGYHGHKGFNWRRLQKVIENRMKIDSIDFTPMPRLGSLLNSQIWFVCKTIG